MNFIIIYMLMYCYCALSKEIPSYVHLCKRHDPKFAECFTNTMYELMPHLIQGIPEMDIPPIDPLEISSLKVETGNTGNIDLNINILHGTLSGLRNLKIENLKANFGDEIVFSTILTVPEVNIEGNYTVKGKILLFDLDGTGHMSFNASDVRSDSEWIGHTYTKKNKEHIILEKILFKEVQIKDIRVKFEDLLGPNNEAITDTVGNAINENIDNLRGELEPIIKESLIQIVRQYFNRVYKLFSIDELYPIE